MRGVMCSVASGQISQTAHRAVLVAKVPPAWRGSAVCPVECTPPSVPPETPGPATLDLFVNAVHAPHGFAGRGTPVRPR